MKFGFVLPNNWGLEDPAFVIDLAVEAEERGFDSVWVNHHIANVGYIGDRLGSRPYYDALTVLTWAAARTTEVGLGTSVLVVPYLHPLVTAKALATIDQLSGGRVIAGLGVGSLPEENEVLGLDYENRGAYADEFIEVMRAAWSEGLSSHHGPLFGFEEVAIAPNPAQNPLPIWVGGSGARARSRAVTYGQGWHPLCSLEGLKRRMPTLDDALAAAGRSRTKSGPDGGFVVAPRVGVSALADTAAVNAWQEAGADQLIVMTNTADPDEIRAGLAHAAGLLGD